MRDPFYSTAPNFLANWNENAKKQADANSESDMTVYNSQIHQNECGDIYRRKAETHNCLHRRIII